MNEVKIILSMYLPIFIFIIAVIVILKIKKTQNWQININFFGFLDFALPIKSNHLYKMILFCIAIIFLGFYYVFLDFTKFFANNLKITVHFDEYGINTLLDELDITELNGLQIDRNYLTKQLEYLKNTDKLLNNYLDYQDYYGDFITDSVSTIETRGDIILVLKKISGIQNYQITEGSGKITHKKYVTNSGETQVYITKFSKLTTQNDKVLIKIKDLFNRLIISPRFNQYLVINGKEEAILNHSLFAVTAFYSFPYPRHSNSLYLYQYKNTLVPIGYAVYYQE